MNAPHSLGLSGRLARAFQSHALTPLLAIVAVLLGVFAIVVTPREEEPQIDVTMVNVLIALPGASAQNVEQFIAIPAEQVLSQMVGIEHVYAVSQPEAALITVQFKVGVDRALALTRIYDVVHSNADWLPRHLGALSPIVKAKGIETVPILALSLTASNDDTSAYDLTHVAHLLENELKRIDGTREISTIGATQRIIDVRLDPARLAAANLSVSDLRFALQAANHASYAGDLVHDNTTVRIETGPFFEDAESVANAVVGVHDGKPIMLAQVADVIETAALPTQYVFHWQRDAPLELPAVTLQISKKTGENAVHVSERVLTQLHNLKGVLIPDDMTVHVTRNYGDTANDKANTLIQKLIFATVSVIALVFFSLGKREAFIVGLAVVLTLTTTLFASWAWGFTLNRVSLFALIFSIGILVDDAIVVVENIHRHKTLYPQMRLSEIVPRAVDEVGGPTILATFTVIAALLPMAFVSGLMGPYMAPIPINAWLGMLLSLAIAFTVTPWLALRWIRTHDTTVHPPKTLASLLSSGIRKIFFALLLKPNTSFRRKGFFVAVGLLLAFSISLPITGALIMKMLPFDNKSEFQIMVDMNEGTALEHTAMVLHEIGAFLQRVPEVENYQAYVGTSAPITFNGLVRQYDLRRQANQGDIQVNLTAKSARAEKSHRIAQRLIPELESIGKRFEARVKLVEVPPGPPVMSPIVLEVYGPDEQTRRQLTARLRQVFLTTQGIVAVDDSLTEQAPQWTMIVDQQKAAQFGVTQAQIASTLRAALHGEDIGSMHDGHAKYPTPIRLRVHHETLTHVNDLLRITVNTFHGVQVPLSELISVHHGQRQSVRHRKDGLPVDYVIGDTFGDNDSPLYGMFAMRSAITDIIPFSGQSSVEEWFVQQPDNAWTHYAVKWDGEWQVTYETFRDMGAAYAVGLVLIYVLVVAQFKSYLTPLIIMAPIPLTIMGVMPGHAILGAQFSATSMIGMIALAGIIVRNSILLVDFIELQLTQGMDFKEAIVQSAQTRAQPILLTALAAMIGALFILDDPIFNGLAISLIFGVMVSTLLTLIVIPLLYYRAYKHRFD